MTYIENVFLCMASPLLIAALCMGKRQRKFFLFCFAGMGVCLLSAYINTFFAALYKADTFAATTEIAPVVEEVMKLLPLLFYLLIFEPKREQIKNTAVVIALSFATFENVCYLIQNGAGHFSFIFFRGIGTGAMHVICGAIVGGGLAYVWQRTWLKIAGTCGLLGAAITFHAIYNLLKPGPGRPGVGNWKNVQSETDRGRVPPGGAVDWGGGHADLFAAPVALASRRSSVSTTTCSIFTTSSGRPDPSISSSCRWTARENRRGSIRRSRRCTCPMFREPRSISSRAIPTRWSRYQCIFCACNGGICKICDIFFHFSCFQCVYQSSFIHQKVSGEV